jgi:membrane dipeptidase
VVEECDRAGIVLDGSHTGKRSTLEIIDRSANPTVFSHSNPSALSPNPRNIDDEQIKACVARGGVIGLTNWAPLVMRPLAERRPTLDDFVDHIDYVAQLTGTTDCIGIGTDMSLGSYPERSTDPWGEPAYGNPSSEYGRKITPDPRSPLRYVEGFDDYAQVTGVIARLEARGYRDSDIRKILGENFLRVFAQVWKPSSGRR